MAHGHVQLSMDKEILLEVNPNLLQCLTLRFVSSDAKAQLDGELAIPHLEWEDVGGGGGAMGI